MMRTKNSQIIIYQIATVKEYLTVRQEGNED